MITFQQSKITFSWFIELVILYLGITEKSSKIGARTFDFMGADILDLITAQAQKDFLWWKFFAIFFYFHCLYQVKRNLCGWKLQDEVSNLYWSCTQDNGFKQPVIT